VIAMSNLGKRTIRCSVWMIDSQTHVTIYKYGKVKGGLVFHHIRLFLWIEFGWFCLIFPIFVVFSFASSGFFIFLLKTFCIICLGEVSVAYWNWGVYRCLAI